jgi:integrase
MRTKVRRRAARGGKVHWYVYVVDNAGKEHSHGGYRTKREADAIAAELSTDGRRGRYVRPSALTFGGFVRDEWLPSRRNSGRTQSTKDWTENALRAWVLPHLGPLPIQAIESADLDRLYEKLRTSGGRTTEKHPDGRPLSAKTVRNVHGLVSKVLGDAVKRKRIPLNPCALMEPPALGERDLRDAWTPDEVRSFLRTAAEDRLAAVWRLALQTGFRRGELCGLQWSDLDLDATEPSVLVHRQVMVRGVKTDAPRLYVRPRTKSGKPRRVSIDPPTAAMLRAWKAAQIADRLAFGAAWRTDGGDRLGIEAAWVVTEPDGSLVHPDTLFDRFVALGKRAGVRRIVLHAARHTYAEVALSHGVRPDVVSANLGHMSGVGFTLDQYAHALPKTHHDAAMIVGGVFDGASEEARADAK